MQQLLEMRIIRQVWAGEGPTAPRSPGPGFDAPLPLALPDLHARSWLAANSLEAATIAVLGTGFTGIELALNLRDRMAVHGGPAAAKRLRIVLVDTSSLVGP